MRNSRSSILICSYIGTFVIAFVIGCTVVDDERSVVVMAYTTVIVNALLAAMALLKTDASVMKKHVEEVHNAICNKYSLLPFC